MNFSPNTEHANTAHSSFHGTFENTPIGLLFYPDNKQPPELIWFALDLTKVFTYHGVMLGLEVTKRFRGTPMRQTLSRHAILSPDRLAHEFFLDDNRDNTRRNALLHFYITHNQFAADTQPVSDISELPTSSEHTRALLQDTIDHINNGESLESLDTCLLDANHDELPSTYH